MRRAQFEASRSSGGASAAARPRFDLEGRGTRHRTALTVLSWVTAGLGAVLFAATIVQSYTVLRGFRAADMLVQDMMVAAPREQLAACARTRTAMAADGALTVRPIADEAVLVCANQVSLPPEYTVRLLAEPQLSGLAVRLQQDAAMAGQIMAKHAREREVWQRRSYWLILLTNNLVMLFAAAAFSLVAFHALLGARARDSVSRARRAVMDAEQSRTSFLAAAGHDLRQPIQAIELFLATLLQRSLDTDARAIIHKVEAAAASMKRMISGLLDVAKLDAGMISTDIVDVELNGLLSSLRGEFERMADASGLTLAIAPTTAVVQTDPVLLESILRNLLSNAIRYTRSGEVGVQVQQHGESVMLCVSDTGVGIPPDKREAIFQDFCRLNLVASEGLGLGLGIVRRLCDLLHCEMSVTSVVGEGSEFSLDLPAGRRSLVPDATTALRDGAGRRTTALLVEDNGTVRDALAGQLQCWDVEVIQAGSGAQARSRIKGAGFTEVDMVIADYHLPDDNGLRLLKDLSVELGRRPCLLITAATEERDLEKIRSSGYPWLPKPLDLDKFRDEVRRLVAQTADNQHAAALSREL